MLEQLARIGARILAGAALWLASTGAHAQPTQTTTPATAEGILHVVWGDPHPDIRSGGATLYSLALADGTMVPLEMSGQGNLATHYFRKRVQVSGRVVPNASAGSSQASPMAIAVESIVPIEPMPQPSQGAAASGTKKVIYLLLKFSDDTAVPHPPSFYTNLNNPDTPPVGSVFPATINGFFKKTSWNQFSWLGDVGGVGGVGASGGWLTLPHPKSHYAPCGWGGSCANLQAISDDGTALGRAQGIDFKLYDNINFVLSNDLDCCAWGGGFYSSVDLKSYGATWEPPWGQDAGTYVHEMGHSLGLPHSGWVYYAYDSPWDMMSSRRSASSMSCGSYFSRNGGGTSGLACTEPGDGYIAAHKDYLGWIPPTNRVETSAGSSLTVDLDASALPASTSTRMIKICLPGLPCTGSTARFFTVEARVGGLGTSSQFDNGLPGNGVLVHAFEGDRPAIGGNCYFNSQSGWAWPIDATPGDYDPVNCTAIGPFPNALSNAQLRPGDTYANSPYGFSVRVLSQTGSVFAVAVSGTQFTIALSASPVAGGTVGGAGTFAAGSSRTVTATASSGYGFSSWTEGGSVVSTAASTTFTLNANRTLVANFVAVPTTYAISPSASPSAGGTVSGGGTYAAGSSRTVAATANSGYLFANWSEGGSVVSTAASYTFTLTANRTLVANFVAVPVIHTITLSVSPALAGTVGGGGSYAAGSSRTVTATAGVGYRFASWTEGGSVVSTAASYTFTLGASRNLVAVFVARSKTSRDFNGDAKSDILARNSADGSVAMLLMNGASIAAVSAVGVLPSNWSVAGAGDFDGDGKSDILLRNSSDGAVVLWLMNGASIVDTRGVAVLPTAWSIAGIGDLDGDGKADIVLRNATDGAVAVWLMNGAAIVDGRGAGAKPGTWSIAGLGDLDGNGKADILWRNAADGAVSVWLMNGASMVEERAVGIVPAAWRIAAVVDLDGDGKADLLWHHGADGSVAAWFMNAATITEGRGVAVLPATWSLAGAGDLDGDGKADIVCRNSTDGALLALMMNGATIVDARGLAVLPLAWGIVP